MPFGYPATRTKADAWIRRYGMIAVLRRVAASGSYSDRQCWVMFQQWSPSERLGKLINPVDRKVVMSPLAPDGSTLVPPDQEQDVLVTYVQPYVAPGVVNEFLRIVEPPGQLDPAGLVVYWTLTVRG